MVTATSAPIGSLYLNSSTGSFYKKLDAGSSTNWVLIATDFAFNLLENPDWNIGTGDWTASGGTYTRTTTAANVFEGTGAASWDSSAAAQTLSSDLIAIPAGLYGVEATLKCKAQCSSGNCEHNFSVKDNTAALLGQQGWQFVYIPSSSGYVDVWVNFTMPLSGSIQAVITSAGTNEPTIYVDACVLSANKNNTGRLHAPLGGQGRPSITMGNDSSAGFWYNGGYNIVVSYGTQNVMGFTNGGLDLYGDRGLLLYNSGNSLATVLKSNSSLAASYTLRLPSNQGAANEVMKNDGSGNFSWQKLSIGAGQLVWVTPVANAPTETFENNNQSYLYESGLAQELYTTIRVPETYTAGNQINLKVPYYSPDSSGTALLSCVATLIRVSTDDIDSTTNQRTSTNAATTLNNANLALSHTCDLTSSTGTINSVAVSAGDLIIVKLTRGTDTATSDIRALINAAEVTFY
jgi:hypothetical protein